MASAHGERGKRLLVTGATGGMGRAASLLAAGEGYELLLADLSLPKLEQLAAECAAHGRSATCMVLDVTQADSIATLVDTLAARGGIDGILHTVGLSPQMADARTIIDVDLVGTVALLERARPHLNTGACAVCIASMSAYMVPADAAIDVVLANPLAGDFFERVPAGDLIVLKHILVPLCARLWCVCVCDTCVANVKLTCCTA